jgi:hypothetical protein
MPIRPRLTRAAGLTAVAGLALMTLSACISVTADMTIDSEAKATGTLSLEFEKQAASFMGISSLDDFKGGISQDDTAGSLASLTDCVASENDTAYVYSCTFADQEFTKSGEAPWTITKQGDTVVMTVVNEGQSADAGSTLGDASLGSISISATFPGPITEVTGEGATKTSDTTVKVEASLTDAVNVTVVSEASGAGPLKSVLLIVGIIVVVGLIALAVIVLLMRRRSGATAEETVVEPVAEESVVEATVVEDVVAEEVVTEDASTVVVETVTEDVPTEVIETVTEDVPPPDGETR